MAVIYSGLYTDLHDRAVLFLKKLPFILLFLYVCVCFCCCCLLVCVFLFPWKDRHACLGLVMKDKVPTTEVM